MCGGGRYDQLIEQLGGKPAPGVGFGLGIERLLLLLEAVGVTFPVPVTHAYAVVPDLATLPQVMPVLEVLRQAGVAVLLNAGGGSMKSQFKKADVSGARYALIFGAEELQRGEVALKALRHADTAAAQTARPLSQAASWAAELLNA